MSGPIWRSSALRAVSDGLRSGSSRIVRVVETSFQLAVRVCTIGVSGLAYASKLLLWQHPLCTQYDWKNLFVERLERMNFMDPLKLDAKTKTRDKLIEKYTSIKGSGSLKDERLNWNFNFSFQVKLHGGAPRRPCCQDAPDDTVVFLAVVYLVVLRCDVKVFWSQELYQLRQPGTLEELRLDSINTDKYCTTYRIELINCCMPYEWNWTLTFHSCEGHFHTSRSHYLHFTRNCQWLDSCCSCSLFSFRRHSIISTPFQFWQRGIP